MFAIKKCSICLFRTDTVSRDHWNACCGIRQHIGIDCLFLEIVVSPAMNICHSQSIASVGLPNAEVQSRRKLRNMQLFISSSWRASDHQSVRRAWQIIVKSMPNPHGMGASRLLIYRESVMLNKKQRAQDTANCEVRNCVCCDALTALNPLQSGYWGQSPQALMGTLTLRPRSISPKPAFNA